MKSHSEFRAAIETTLGRKLDSKHAGAAAAQLRTDYGELRVEIREDTPAIFMRFLDTGERALPDGVGFAGVWDIVPSPGHPADADEREWCVKTLQRRLGLAGYRPPGDPLDQPFDGSLPADKLIAAARATGEPPAGLVADLHKIERLLTEGTFYEDYDEASRLLGVFREALTGPLPRRTIEDVRGWFEPAAGLPALRALVKTVEDSTYGKGDGHRYFSFVGGSPLCTEKELAAAKAELETL